MVWGCSIGKSRSATTYKPAEEKFLVPYLEVISISSHPISALILPFPNPTVVAVLSVFAVRRRGVDNMVVRAWKTQTVGRVRKKQRVNPRGAALEELSDKALALRDTRAPAIIRGRC